MTPSRINRLLGALAAPLALVVPAQADVAAIVFGDGEVTPMVLTTGVDVDGNTATLPFVSMPEDGFLAMHAILDGQPIVPASIGHVAVPEGMHTDVKVEINYPFAEDEGYVAMLHHDSNDNGIYEFGEGSTDVDGPVMRDDMIVAAGFTADGDVLGGDEAHVTPMVVTEDAMVDGNALTLPLVLMPEDGYVVIHAMLDGEPIVPASVGHVAAPAGAHTDLTVRIAYPFASGERYVAMLHAETNGNDMYDFAEGMTDVDTPIMLDGDAVTSVFEVD